MMASAGFGALGRDFRYAARLLRRTPGFAHTSIGLLALTTGANTAVVPFIDALLLKPL